jgi:hypothetical protein
MALKRALTVKNILDKKYKLFDFTGAWYDAFRKPEMTGVWFIWGNSGNGKTSFVIQMIKELARFDNVLLNSREEGTKHTMQENLIKFNMNEASANKVHFVDETINDLTARLKMKKSARIVVIDSFQYMMLSYKEYIEFKQLFPDKLIIFISHADGKNPAGRSAKSVKFDAGLKIWVEGYRAFSHGRYKGPTEEFDIWPEKAMRYWGE